MESKVLKNLIKESPNFEWGNTVELTVNYNYADYSVKLDGIFAILQYFKRQDEGWKAIEYCPEILKNSVGYFKRVNSSIGAFFTEKFLKEKSNIEYQWSEIIKVIENVNREHPIPFDHPLVTFFDELEHNKTTDFVNGAFHFISDKINGSLTSKSDYFAGVIMAYEFKNKDSSQLISQRQKERKSLNSLRNQFESQLNSSKTELIEHLKDADEKVDVLENHVLKEQNSYTVKFQNWFDSIKETFNEFDQNSTQSIDNLEKIYKEKLKLEAPAKYWEDRATDLKKEGWKFTRILIFLICIVISSLACILWKVPDELYSSFFKTDKSAAIRWSIVYITFISFMAYSIKVVTKAMFSSFHLSRDSQERYTLTYFYLSLIKDSDVSSEEKQLIMQSLFSRSDTGLLKDDSSPSMPSSDIIKVFGSK
jgi:hypothetical protein